MTNALKAQPFPVPQVQGELRIQWVSFSTERREGRHEIETVTSGFTRESYGFLRILQEGALLSERNAVWRMLLSTEGQTYPIRRETGARVMLLWCWPRRHAWLPSLVFSSILKSSAQNSQDRPSVRDRNPRIYTLASFEQGFQLVVYMKRIPARRVLSGLFSMPLRD
jgi:hypothetical protein